MSILQLVYFCWRFCCCFAFPNCLADVEKAFLKFGQYFLSNSDFTECRATSSFRVLMLFCLRAGKRAGKKRKFEWTGFCLVPLVEPAELCSLVICAKRPFGMNAFEMGIK